MEKIKSFAKKHPVWSVIIVLVVIGFIGSLFSSPDKNTNSQPTTTTQTQSNNDFDRIQSASERQSFLVTDGLEEGLTISEIYTIKSNDYDNVYFIGGLVNGPGIENQIMIWATGGYEDISLTFSAESVAAEFSDWPLGRDTQVGVDANKDEGASILKDYLKTKK